MPEKKETNKHELVLLDYATRGLQTVKEKEVAQALILAIATEHNLPIFGITILGGRPYVNVTGLDSKLQNDPRKVKRVDYEVIQRANKENGYLAGYVGIVEFEDTPVRMQMRTEIITEALRQNKSFEEIKRIIQVSGLSPPIYRDEGWNSPRTSAAICYEYRYSQEQRRKVPYGEPLVENVNMMGIRKATNRAKRHAVGCGLTSVEEVGQVSPELKPAEAVEVKKDEALEPEDQQNLPLK